MRRSIFALRALATLTLTSASALPQHAARGILADQTFSCSGGQSLSLCCASRVPSNGAAEDCQESLHFMIGPTRLSPNDLTRQIDSAAVNQCSSEQLKKGFNRPVCCKAGFRPAVGGPGYNGINCVDAKADGGSRWSFEPRKVSYSKPKYSGESRLASRSTSFLKGSPLEGSPLARGPLAASVETIPIADDEARIFALSPEPEFPERLEGSPGFEPSDNSADQSSILSEADLPIHRRSLRKRSSEIIPDAEPSGSGHQTQDAVLKDLLTSTPDHRRSLNKRSSEPFTDAEPSGSGHQTQDAVLMDLLTSTSLIQRASRLGAPEGAGILGQRSRAIWRRSPKDMSLQAS